MKETLWHLLKEKDKTTTTDMIHNFKQGLKKSPVLNVMKNSGVKEISKYTKKRKPFAGYVSGTPAHVKSAINFNDLLSMHNIRDIDEIIEGFNMAVKTDDVNFDDFEYVIYLILFYVPSKLIKQFDLLGDKRAQFIDEYEEKIEMIINKQLQKNKELS